MNKTGKLKREIYIILADEVSWELCSFCKYNRCEGSPCEGFGEGCCTHPLDHRFSEYVEPGDDCWGFRPEYSVSICADIVGAVLANKWAEAAWWTEDKKIFITGNV
jgi:hypothetical protein